MDRPRRRKLLVASLGLASVSYVLACGKKDIPVSGNLPAPPPTETTPISGNLPAPPPPEADAEADTDADAGPTAAQADAGKATGKAKDAGK